MHISVTEHSLVILGQTKYLKKWRGNAPKEPKLAEAKSDGVINPQNYNINQF